MNLLRALPALLLLCSLPAGSQQLQQSVTTHQLLAPVAARTAAEKAARAIANNDRKEAQKQLSRALGAYPEYAVALTLRGVLELNERRIEAATADLKAATHADPSYALPYLVLASIYTDAGQMDDALVLLPTAIRLLPSAWQSHFEMARALAGKKDYPTALREVTEALRLAPGSVPLKTLAFVHHLRARILLQLADSSGAKEEFMQALKQDPDGEFGISSRKALEILQSSNR